MAISTDMKPVPILTASLPAQIVPKNYLGTKAQFVSVCHGIV